MTEIAKALSRWYEQNKRSLPFRQSRDPYRIWVSEIMAQQTRIEAMLPYYQRFMLSFPDIKNLAQCPDDLLLKHWQGLGYYSRARNLKKAAIQCMEEFDGKLPQERKQLLSLAGIGEYTAGAICSMAYGQKEPALDGNGIRIFSRLLASSADYTSVKKRRELAGWIKEQMPDEKPGDFNQAVMDLGSMICLPKNPRCNLCPLQYLCKAGIEGNPADYPYKKQKKARKILTKCFYVCVYQDKTGSWIGLEQRTEKDVLQGMYGFTEKKPQATDIKSTVPLEGYRHIFSHKEWEVQGELLWMKKRTESMIRLEDARKKAVPSAFLPLYEQSLKLLEGK